MRHHQDVPYRLLHCNGKLSAGDPDSENLLVHGDNLEALKALMPHYAGKVKCIYIDPPYNTGNEQWHYNDRVNSPQIQRWLGKVVGGETEDMCRHDKWLCMMYPRLRLLRSFLRPDGVIFVSIDDNEQHRLRMMMDEIFGAGNFISNIIWQKKYAPAGDATFFSDNHDFVVCYAKRKDKESGWQRQLLPRTDKQNKLYKHDDDDGMGLWRTDNLTAKTYSEEYDYPITNPLTGEQHYPSQGVCWRTSKENMQKWIAEGRVFFGVNGKGRPQLKRYLNEVKDGVVPLTVWTYDEVGHTDGARKVLKNIFKDEKLPFDNPKSVGLLERIITVAGDKNSLVLDSFTGSGTTAHAVLSLNKQDGGKRRFICVEMDDNICENVTAKRISAVVGGRKGKEPLDALGGGFRYCTLGVALFDKSGKINESVKFSDLAAHIFFSETGTPIPKRASGKTPLIGVHGDKAVYLLYNGVIADKSAGGGNVLTSATLKLLPPHPKKGGARIVYAANSRLGESRLARDKIILRQMPYHIKKK